MQGRLAFFGAGVLAGVGAGTGYWRNYQQLKLDESVNSQREEAETSLEQRLFKYVLNIHRPSSMYILWIHTNCYSTF